MTDVLRTTMIGLRSPRTDKPDEIKDEAQLKKWLSLLDIQEINERLEDAIADENYEYAKMYKDELRRREEEEDTNK